MRRRPFHSICGLSAALLAIVLGGCGGGGGGSDAEPSATIAPTRPVEQSDLQIAQALYTGTPRTPVGFHSDPAPSGYLHVATSHLKNADVGAATAAQPLYELCTNDFNEALGWSESSAQLAPQYADLVETSDDPRFFEFGRVRHGEPTFYLRARVFKCAYLDRTAADLRVGSGPAGQLNQRPLIAADLRTLSEYLWQFTSYNNVGHVVLNSTGSSASGQMIHTLHIGSLDRGGVSSTCDRIEVVAWRHTLDVATGRLQLEVLGLWSFGAREQAGAVQLCSG